MPYCQGPYELHPFDPPPRSVLHSSRRIDFVKGDYVAADDGGFESMPSTAQRVALLVCFAIGPRNRQRFITPAENIATEQRIREALAPLVADGLIRINSIDVANVAAGYVERAVNFTDLTARRAVNQSVQT